MGPRVLVVLAVLAGCNRGPSSTTRPSPDTGSATTASVIDDRSRPAELAEDPVEAGRPNGDWSRAWPSWWQTEGVVLSAPKTAKEGELRGEVTAIRPAGKTPGAVRIEPKRGAAVELPLTGAGRLALAVRDEVTVKWRTTSIGRHAITDIVVTRRDGSIVYAHAGDGDATFAPGWRVEVRDVRETEEPGMVDGARRASHWVSLALGDATAMVAESDGARRLSTKQGVFAVSASSIRWSEGVRPPDASSYDQFTIVRSE
jgi:hypothetical protein